MIISNKKEQDSVIKRQFVLFYKINSEDKMVIETRNKHFIIEKNSIQKRDITYKTLGFFLLSILTLLFYFYGGIMFLYNLIIKDGIINAIVPIFFYLLFFSLFVYLLYKEKTFLHYGIYENEDLIIYTESEQESKYIKAWLYK